MEVKPNTGVLFKNDRKTEDRHPDYTGSVTLEDGLDYYLDAWKNQSKGGKNYLKIRIGKQKVQGNTAPQHPAADIRVTQPEKATGFADLDDDIPF